MNSLNIFECFLIWYVCGVIGVSIVTYYDSKNGVRNDNDHLAMYLLVCILGMLALLYGLLVVYWEHGKNE